MAERSTRSDRAVGAALRAAARQASVPSDAIREDDLIDAVPELAVLGETPQDPRWHPEGDVLVHSLWAADLAAAYAERRSVDPDRRELLVLAALVHDIGKPQTTRRMDGRITSHGHAERGAEVFRTMGRRLALPRPLVEAVAAIVETHMAHLSVSGRAESPGRAAAAPPTRGSRHVPRRLGRGRTLRRRSTRSRGAAGCLRAVAPRRRPVAVSVLFPPADSPAGGAGAE